MLRKLFAVIGSLVLVSATLTACSPTDPKTAAYAGLKQVCKTFVTGPSADQIKVTSTGSGKPKVSFPTPLTSKKVETKVLIEGSGPAFTGNQLVDLDFIGLNGTTGTEFQATNFDGKSFTSQLFKPDSEPNFCDALGGVKEGSTVAVDYPAALIHENQGIDSLNIGKNDDVIFVFKLNKIYLPRAVGDSQPLKDGFPQVVTANDGTPGLVLQNWDTPAFKAFAKETLIKGRGEVVKLDDTVTVHYTGWVWSASKTLFDSSWNNGAPVQFQLSRGQLIEGFIKALEGETVGSQVIAVIPPGDGYGDQEQGTIPANSTLIFVVDILGTSRASTNK